MKNIITDVIKNGGGVLIVDGKADMTMEAKKNRYNRYKHKRNTKK